MTGKIMVDLLVLNARQLVEETQPRLASGT